MYTWKQIRDAVLYHLGIERCWNCGTIWNPRKAYGEKVTQDIRIDPPGLYKAEIIVDYFCTKCYPLFVDDCEELELK